MCLLDARHALAIEPGAPIGVVNLVGLYSDPFLLSTLQTPTLEVVVIEIFIAVPLSMTERCLHESSL